MADFHFDESKSFAENCVAFLEMSNSDCPDNAAILANNWDALFTVVWEWERDSKALGDFNTKVASALDALVKPAGPKDVA
jgi:hypothetical protein